MNKFKSRIALYIISLVTIVVSVVAIICIAAYKNLDLTKTFTISGSIGGALIILIVVLFLIDRHNVSSFITGEKLEFVIKKFYFNENNEQIGYDFELYDDPGVLYHRNVSIAFYGLEPDTIHGYAYVNDGNLEVDDTSLFKVQKEKVSENNSWNTPKETSSEAKETSEQTSDENSTESPLETTKKDYSDDVVIVDDEPTERDVKEPVKKIVDNDGEDDWSRAI